MMLAASNVRNSIASRPPSAAAASLTALSPILPFCIGMVLRALREFYIKISLCESGLKT